MKLLYQGKTKDVYRDRNDNVVLKFKDDVTGTDGEFDPGADTVGLSIEGAGYSALKMTTYFFEKLQKTGIPTHYISTDYNDVSMTVKDAEMFGNGLEVICRYRAVGSFYRRYGAYCEEGEKLDGIVEVTIKDDVRQDPPISKEALVALNILKESEYDKLVKLTKDISLIVKEELKEKGLELYDIKLEFGKDRSTSEIILIDEISGGNMRVYNAEGQFISPLKLGELFD